MNLGLRRLRSAFDKPGLTYQETTAVDGCLIATPLHELGASGRTSAFELRFWWFAHWPQIMFRRALFPCLPSARYEDFLRATLLPFLRASDSPMAIACFLLVTFFPLPLLSVPLLRRRIVDSTSFDALLDVLRDDDFFRAAIATSIDGLLA